MYFCIHFRIDYSCLYASKCSISCLSDSIIQHKNCSLYHSRCCIFSCFCLYFFFSLPFLLFHSPSQFLVAPENQLFSNCSILSDMFSLGLVMCSIFNQGHALIQANNSASTYLKQLEAVSIEFMLGELRCTYVLYLFHCEIIRIYFFNFSHCIRNETEINDILCMR